MRTPLRPDALAASLLLVSCAASPAGAAVTRYWDRTAFLSQSTADSVALHAEGFESLAATNAFAGAIIATPLLSANSTQTSGIWNQPFQGATASQGANYLAVSTSPMKLVLTLSIPRTHFAFTLADWGDSGTGIITFATDVSSAVIVTDTRRPDGEHYFAGFISTVPFTTVTLTSTNATDSFGLDDVLMGTVPAPSASCAFACAALFAARRRRPLS